MPRKSQRSLCNFLIFSLTQRSTDWIFAPIPALTVMTHNHWFSGRFEFTPLASQRVLSVMQSIYARAWKEAARRPGQPRDRPLLGGLPRRQTQGPLRSVRARAQRARRSVQRGLQGAQAVQRERTQRDGGADLGRMHAHGEGGAGAAGGSIARGADRPARSDHQQEQAGFRTSPLPKASFCRARCDPARSRPS